MGTLQLDTDAFASAVISHNFWIFTRKWIKMWEFPLIFLDFSLEQPVVCWVNQGWSAGACTSVYLASQFESDFTGEMSAVTDPTFSSLVQCYSYK